MGLVEAEPPIRYPEDCGNPDGCLGVQKGVTEQLQDYRTRQDVKDSEIRVFCRPSTIGKNGRCKISVSHTFKLSYTDSAGSSLPVRKTANCSFNNPFE